MKFEIEEIEFNEELFQKNLEENEFIASDELDGKGNIKITEEEEKKSNEEKKAGDNDATN